MDPLLEIRGLRKRFGGVEALRGVDLDLHRGEVLGVVGDNGAGKSTLIKIISGVFPPNSGEVTVDGRRMSAFTPNEAKGLGVETIYQDLSLAEDLNVGDNVFLGREPVRRLFGLIPIIDRRSIARETTDLLSRVESVIADQRVRVKDLSGGQRQAVAIARALYWHAKVVIMDEPTAALAVVETRNVLRLARSLATEGVGVVYIGHNLVEILEVADRVAVMYRGQNVFQRQSSDTSQEELIKYMTGYSEADASGAGAPSGATGPQEPGRGARAEDAQ